MKIACQEDMIPGQTLREKVLNLERYGIDAIEITDGAVRDRAQEIKDAIKGTSVKVSTICIKPSNALTNNRDLLHSDPMERKKTLEEMKRLLDVSAEVGALGVIFVPIYGRKPMIPDLSPLRSAIELENELLALLLRELADHAEKVGSLILLEPIHRYITHFLTTIEHGVRICDRVGSEYVKVMVDVFQSINEEVNVNESIRKYSKYVRHIHLSDNNRLLPGLGSTDFRTLFSILKEVGFKDYLALECTVKPGDSEQFHGTMKFIRECMQG